MSQAKVVKSSITGIDPKQHKINVVMTDGSKVSMLTTWGSEGETLKLDVDPKNHPAWQENGQSFINSNDARMEKFKNKFGDFTFGAKK
jgi:large subunit ribosomal protein L31